MKKTNQIKCPDCKGNVTLGTKIEVGDIVECENCGTEIEIKSVNPLKYSELIEEK